MFYPYFCFSLGEDPLWVWVKGIGSDPLRPVQEADFHMYSFTSQVRSCPAQSIIVSCNERFQNVAHGNRVGNIPNGKYIDAITGDVQNVTRGMLTVSSIGKGNMRIYVCCASGFIGINGAVGQTGQTYLK